MPYSSVVSLDLTIIDGLHGVQACEYSALKKVQHPKKVNLLTCIKYVYLHEILFFKRCFIFSILHNVS